MGNASGMGDTGRRTSDVRPDPRATDRGLRSMSNQGLSIFDHDDNSGDEPTQVINRDDAEQGSGTQKTAQKVAEKVEEKPAEKPVAVQPQRAQAPAQRSQPAAAPARPAAAAPATPPPAAQLPSLPTVRR